MTEYSIESIAEEIRDLFALQLNYCSGVDIKPLSQNILAIPILLDNGQRFGIIVERIK